VIRGQRRTVSLGRYGITVKLTSTSCQMNIGGLQTRLREGEIVHDLCIFHRGVSFYVYEPAGKVEYGAIGFETQGAGLVDAR
jgi:hypothetical protein